MHLLSNGKWQPLNKKHEDIYELNRIIDSLNRNLKAVGLKRGLRADSLRAELLFTLGITHWLRGEFDTGSVFKSEYLPLTQKSLVYSRKAKLGNMTSENYLNLLQNDLPIEDQIKWLEQWTGDYPWLIKATPRHPANPFEMLARLYVNIHDEKA